MEAIKATSKSTETQDNMSNNQEKTDLKDSATNSSYSFKSAPFFKSLFTLSFNDISIVQRIIASFVFAILIFFLGTLLINSTLNKYVSQKQCIDDIYTNLHSISLSFAQLSSHSNATKERLNISDKINSLERLLNNKDNISFFDNDEHSKKIISTLNSYSKEIKDLLKDNEANYLKGLENSINTISTVDTLTKSGKMKSPYSHITICLYSVIGISGIVLILLTIFLSKSLNSEVKHVWKSLRRLAAGDLTSSRNNNFRKNEIGNIDKLVDDVADSMKKTVSKLNLDFNKMVHMVNDNSSMLDSTSDAISIQREKAHSVAEATANMESSIEKVTEFARSTLSEVKNAETASDTCRCTMQDNITTTHSLSNKLKNTSIAISNINEMGEQINAIVKTIAAIADQTNLLALNATIEAARTGEHGKGFAVVASEVRDLATKTAESTKEVADTIANLSAAVKSCVTVVASCEEEMNNSVYQSSKANSAIEEIMGIIATITDMSEQIVHSCQEQSAIASDVNHAINNINSITDECFVNITDSKQNVHEIKELAQNQVDNLSTFKTDIN